MLSLESRTKQYPNNRRHEKEYEQAEEMQKQMKREEEEVQEVLKIHLQQLDNGIAWYLFVCLLL